MVKSSFSISLYNNGEAPIIEKVEGYKVQLPFGLTGYVRKNESGDWNCTEEKTGLTCGRDSSSRQKAIDSAINIIGIVGKEKTLQYIEGKKLQN